MGSSKPAHDDFPRYLGAILKGAGMNADQIDGLMQPWWTSLAKNQRPLVGTPPRGSTLRNWLSRETQPTTDKLTPLCGFLLYGRVGEPPDWRKAQTMAQRLREGPYDTFLDDYRLTIVDGPASQRANAEVAKYKDDLMAAAIQALKETHQHIVSTFSEVAADPALMGTYFGAIAIGKKSLTHFDMLAETQLMRSLRRFDPGIDVFGEETLGDFAGWTSPFGVLGDALDGSDLLQQAINLWCSAVVLYERETQTIFASAICFSSGRICYARADQKKAYWYVEGGDPVLFRGCSDMKSLDEARVAFFGQKAKNLAWLSSNKMLTDFLARVEPALASPAAPNRPQMEDKTAFRLYNFAGNAVIAQMADRHKRGRRFIAGIDAVFESFGQKPHDFVPGAFIAKRCGAYLQDLAGKEITYADLDAMIANPTHRGQPYVIAATDELATAVRKLVRAR